MTGWAYVIMAAIGTFVFQWPLWLALVTAQAYNLIAGVHMHRWLPTVLLGIGAGWCFLRPILFWRA